MLVPKLRFKREDGTDYPEWESKTLQEVTSHFQSGKAINRSNIAQTGKYAVYGGNGLRGFTDSYNHCGDYVLIGRQGALCGNVCFVSGKNYFTEHAIAVQANSENYLPFLLYQFDNMNLGQYSGQSAQAGLAVSRITQVTANFPHIEEQQKIADFLSTVDEVIAQSEAEVQNLEQQKKAAMQKIFSQEVRFKREDGTDYPEWEENTVLNVLGKVSSGKTKPDNSGSFPLYGSMGVIGTCLSANYKGKKLLIARVGANAGTINYVEEDCGVTDNTLVICNEVENLKYFYYALQECNLGKMVIGSGQPLITGRGVQNVVLLLPCLEEQQKIADFLSAYDEAIRYAKQELDKWKELKKGLLQQMFV